MIAMDLPELFDFNTALGHWPFRKVPHETPAELRAALESAGITGAAVANTHGLFYKNCHDANLELAEWLAPHADFFVGVGTLNPAYAAWERDLKVCRERLGMAALRLTPQYHGYTLDDGRARALVRAAAQMGLTVLIPHRVVDVRQHHWLDTDRVIASHEIGALCTAVPEARVVVTEAAFGPGELMDEKGVWRHAGLYLESSRMDIDALGAEVAAHRIVFGTGAPFKHPEPALLKLKFAQVGEAARRRIAAAHARELLGAGRSS